MAVARALFLGSLAICNVAMAASIVADVAALTREPSLSLPRPVSTPPQSPDADAQPRAERA
jgi:hypothetical protein